jgi:5-keto-L-gluconate epimerase
MSIKLALAVAPENALMSAFVVFRDKLEHSMVKAAKLGFDGIELALLNRDQVDLPNVKRMMKETGLDIPMVSTGQIFADTAVSFTHLEKEKREKALADFLGLMEVASEFGSLINIGRLRGSLNEGSPSLDYFNEYMSRALKRSEELGVTIALEPVNRYEINFLNNCADTAKVIRNLGHPNLTMMPDVFHMNIEDPSIEGSLVKYADLISYVHFADSNRWAPGRGHLDFLSIITALKTSGFEGYASLEILPYPDPDQAALEGINTIRKYI